MTLSYKSARGEIMRAMQVMERLMEHSAAPEPLSTRLKLFSALHRELAAIDSEKLGQSTEEYNALTLRFASSKKELKDAYTGAKDLANNLGLTAQFLQSLSKLAAAL